MVFIENVAHITVQLYDHHFWCMYLPLLTTGLETYDSSFSTFSYSANNFFLFVEESKNADGSPGLPLGAAGCGIQYGQISPYHQLCQLDNTFTATRPADL